MRYWSNSKFADWVRGIPKLESAAGVREEWKAWDAEARKRPIRYWLAEEGLDYLSAFVHFPSKLIHGIQYRIANRFVTKTHALTSNLKKYQWYDLDTRILNCLFDELVNHVEVEVAIRNGDNVPKYARLRGWRDPEQGREYFHWLLREHPSLAGSFEYANEVLTLYGWWKEVRPQRKDPYDASGWSAWCEAKDIFGKLSDEDEEKEKAILSELQEMEQKYEEEDTEMLIRLIKIRGHLWT